MDKLDLILQELSEMKAQISTLDNKIEVSRKETIHEVRVLLDTEVTTKFNLLVESLDLIDRKITPEDRIEAVEEDVDTIKRVVKHHSEEITLLKQAN